MAIEGYDLVMLGILAAAAVLGYLKGMVWQVAWIAGIAASTFVALRFGSEVAPYVGQQPPWNRLIAMPEKKARITEPITTIAAIDRLMRIALQNAWECSTPEK